MEKKRFVDDISVKGALTGILIRSPVVSGILEEIKTPKLPYNITLVGAADIPGLAVCRVTPVSGETGYDGTAARFFEIPIFPGRELSWYGQPVAMLVGPDPVKLREFAELCTVVVSRPPGKTSGTAADNKTPAADNIIISRNYRSGSVDEAFAKAETVVKGTYNAGLQEPWPSDPPGAIAIPGPDSSMTIHTATQWPGHVRASVAQCLGIKSALVEIDMSRLEIHLDSKIWQPSLLACQAAVGARLRGKPVKLILKRDEDFLFSPKSAGAEITLQSALDKDGSLLGTKLGVTVNFGAAGMAAPEILDRVALGALGAYNHKSVSLAARGISSPIPPAGPITGFGQTQGFFAAERHASHIADTLGADPAEWRKNFFLRKGKKLAIGVDMKNPPPEALIDSAETMSGYRRKWASYELLRKNRRESTAAEKKPRENLRGIGISLAYQGNSLLHPYRGVKSPEEGVELTLEKDGVLEIRTELPWGDNQIRIWHELAAKILGVEHIRLVSKREKAKNVPESGPACLSRSTGIIAPLIEKACNAIRKQRFRDPLPITVHRYYHAAKTPAWDGAAKIDENALASPGWGCAVVEAEVDPVSYIPKVRGIWLCIDGGTILSDERAKKSMSAASLQALSWAMQEEVVYKEGRIDESLFRDYVLWTEEPPPVAVDFLWSEGAPRGIGDLPFATVPSAYAQALSQALDYHFCRYPIASRDIWTAVKTLSGEMP